MEAMDIWREEKTKMDEYHEECKIAGQKVKIKVLTIITTIINKVSPTSSSSYFESPWKPNSKRIIKFCIFIFPLSPFSLRGMY